MDLEIIQLIIEYRYLVLFPLLILDGTTFGFIGGILAGAGVFNPIVVYIMTLAAKSVGDPFVYYSARSGATYLERFSFGRKIFLRLRDGEGRADEIIELIDKHFVKLMIITKSLPIPSLSTSLYVIGGALKFPARKVFLGTIIVQPFLSAFVVGLGYFFGGMINSPEGALQVLGLVVVLGVALFVVYQRMVRPRLQKSRVFKTFREWLA